MSDIFISYAKEDAARAKALATILSERGWSVWWDRKIPIGKTFDEVIEAALAGARCVIVLWTRASVASSWVKVEADEGRKRGVLVPLLLDPVPLPLAFRYVQFADLTAWDGHSVTSGIEEVIAAVAGHAGPPALEPKTRSPEERTPAAREPGSREPAAVVPREPPVGHHLLLAAALALPLSALAVWLAVGRGDPEATQSGTETRQQTASSVAVARNASAASAAVAVVAGEFFMGCNETVDSECFDNEKPGRKVNVAAFSIDRTEVTVAAFAACVDAGGCRAEGLTEAFWNGQRQPDRDWACTWGKPGKEQHPLNCVGWSQAEAYCRWAGSRLPTEAEWEKAARGTDGRKYAWGNEGYRPAQKRANLADETAKRQYPDWKIADGYDDGYVDTAPVGSFPEGASPHGALDMIGNVWEWTSDWYTQDEARSVRGGSWNLAPRSARASSRGGYGPGVRFESVGFRCAR